MVNITFMVNFYYIYGWCYIMIFNLEKIYFPSCSSRMISLHHSFLHVPLDIWKPEGRLPYEKARDACQKIILFYS